MPALSKYSEEELGVLRSLFDGCDPHRSGRVHLSQLAGVAQRLGKTRGKTLTPNPLAAARPHICDALRRGDRCHH